MVFAFEMSAQLVTEHSISLCCQAKGFYKQQKMLLIMIENWAGSEVSMDWVCSGLIWCCTHLSVPVQGASGRALSFWPDALMCSDVYTDLCSKTKNSPTCIFSFVLLQAVEFSSAWIPWSWESGQVWKRWHFSPSYWEKFSDFERSSWETILESVRWEVSCVSVLECWASLWP